MSGCAYVHFGRIPPTDTALSQENTDLRLEKKMLQQELVIARKEGDALRSTIDASANGADVDALTKRLAEATRELTALRLSSTKISAEGNIRTLQGEDAQMATLRQQVADAQANAADARKDTETLKTENGELRKQLSEQKDQNRALVAQVQDLGAESSRLQDAVSQLNTELLAQKDARNQADQRAEAARAELRTVLAEKTANGTASSFGDLREGTASGAATLESGPVPAKPVVEGSATAILTAHVPAASSVTTPSKVQSYIVQEGATLEKISKQFYGTTERWNWIYAANNEMLRGGRPLRAGMKLVIPDSAAISP